MKRTIFLTVLFIGMVQFSCHKENASAPSEPDQPNSRTFRMGFTPFPFDLSVEAQIKSAEYAQRNGDIILAHFDHGVPWNEALNDLPFPNEVQNAIEGTKSIVTPEHKVVLTATPISISRNGLAQYWNDGGSHQELPQPWDTYNFASPEVISAFTKYCKRIIDAIQPDYFAYGIEVNAEFKKNTEIFEQYLVLVDAVYNVLKDDYPDLPVFLTFQDQSFNKSKQELHELTKILLAYSDIIAVSTYPFWQYDFPNRDSNPSLFSDNWLQDMRNLAPDKPFAVSETGFIAEDLVLNEVDVHVKGSPEWQADYLEKLFMGANHLEAEFILWFIYRDYDLLYDHTPDPEFILKIWRDNGLLDGAGNPRIAHDVWDVWKERALN